MNLIWFMSGVSFTGFAASSLFFVRFWRTSRDRFFMYFAGATGLLAAERVANFFVPGVFDGVPPGIADRMVYVYSFRLVAFALIIVAFVEKNRRR